MRKVKELNDFNAQELLLREALAQCEQNVLSVGNAFSTQVESELGLIQKRRELLVTALHPADEIREKSNNLKVSVCLVFELLRLAGKGLDVNDLTTLAQFASLITGFSKITIVNTMQKGFCFSERYHGAAIREANEVLRLLGVPVVLDIGGRY